MAGSSHHCLIHTNKITCTLCANSIPFAAEHIYDFLESHCLPRQYTLSYAIGTQHTHSSHNIVLHGCVYICTSCGNTASNKIIKISESHAVVPPLMVYITSKLMSKAKPRGDYHRQWPYKAAHMSDDAVLDNIQGQINNTQVQIMAKVTS